MKELTKEELLDVQGGGITIGGVLLVIAGVTFVIGVIDGIVRPLKCN